MARVGSGSYTRPGLSSGSSLAPPSVAEYEPPAYDEGKVRAYQQEALAPAVSGLRRSMREAQAGRYSSPAARREALRGVTRGYGEALAPLQVGAGNQARARYDIQYQQQVRAAEIKRAAEARERERAYMESQREEERAVAEEEDRVIVGYNAASRPIYMSRQEAAGYFDSIGGSTQPSISGLTDASRRPLRDTTGSTGLQYPETTSAAPYPQDWMS